MEAFKAPAWKFAASDVEVSINWNINVKSWDILGCVADYISSRFFVTLYHIYFHRLDKSIEEIHLNTLKVAHKSKKQDIFLIKLLEELTFAQK